MTALAEPIKFNSGSGSNTTASGSAASGASCSGTGAAPDGTTTVDLSADTPISGFETVAAGDLFWVDATSGREFSVIASTVTTAGSESVTLDDTIALGSGLNWGIGGSRGSIDDAGNRTLFTNHVKVGWILELEDDHTITSSLTPIVNGNTTTGGIIFRSDTPGTQRVITCSINAAVLKPDGNYWLFEGLTLKSSNGGTSSHGIEITANTIECTFKDCIIGDPSDTDNLYHGYTRTANQPRGFKYINCAFINCISTGFNKGYGDDTTSFFWCVFDNNGSHGWGSNINTTLMDTIFHSCVFTDNNGAGISWENPAAASLMIINCTFDGNTGDGFQVTNSGHDLERLIFLNNIMSNNARGVDVVSKELTNSWVVDYNNYYNNATADRRNFPTGVNDISLDPGYDDAANDNYAVGANMKAAGYPTAPGRGVTPTFIDIGAAQREEPTGTGISQGLHSINSGITT